MLCEECLPSEQPKCELKPQHKGKNHIWQVAQWKICLEFFPSGLLSEQDCVNELVADCLRFLPIILLVDAVLDAVPRTLFSSDSFINAPRYTTG